MIESIRNMHARELCTLARDDASTLAFPLPDAIFGFHAQQSFEKAMKALISVHRRVYPFNHDLKGLIAILHACGEQLPAASFDLATLQPYAVQLRYHVGDALTQDERVHMKQAVDQYYKHVLNRILHIEATTF